MYSTVRRCLTLRPPTSSPHAITTQQQQQQNQLAIDMQAARVNFQSFLSSLNTSSDTYLPPTPVGMAGSGGHVVHNPHLTQRPWEPSMVELRNTQPADEELDRLQQLRKIQIDFRALRRQTKAADQIKTKISEEGDRDRQVNSNSNASNSHQDDSGDEDTQEVVLYYETSSEAGLQGFQTVAALVLEGKLPGECSNLTGQRGYATWSIPKKTFVSMAATQLKLMGREGADGGSVHGEGSSFLRLESSLPGSATDADEPLTK